MAEIADQGFSGGCLCGAVRYRSAVDPQLVGQCHCVDCRKTSATDHAVHLVIPEDALTVTGEVRFYDRPADSGNIVARGFCPKCAAAIYSKNSGMPGMVFVRGSSLDDLEIGKPQMIGLCQPRAVVEPARSGASDVRGDAGGWAATRGRSGR